MKLEKFKIFIETKTTLEFFFKQKIIIFNLKDFIFYKNICKMYTL